MIDALPALYDYVTFGLNLCMPHPVMGTRSWLHLEELKQELHSLRIGVPGGEDIDGKKARQEWVQVRLARHIRSRALLRRR